MVRKVVLSVVALVALMLVGTSSAEAHGPQHCRGGYGYGGYGHYPAYRGAYYGGPGYYGGPAYYGGPNYYRGSGVSYYSGRGYSGRSYSGVGISIGF